MRWFLFFCVLISSIVSVASWCRNYHCAAGDFIEKNGDPIFHGSKGLHHSPEGCALTITPDCVLGGGGIATDHHTDANGNSEYVSKVPGHWYGTCKHVREDGESHFICFCNKEDYDNCHLDYVDKIIEMSGYSHCRETLKDIAYEIGDKDKCFTRTQYALAIGLPLLALFIISVISGIVGCICCCVAMRKLRKTHPHVAPAHHHPSGARSGARTVPGASVPSGAYPPYPVTTFTPVGPTASTGSKRSARRAARKTSSRSGRSARREAREKSEASSSRRAAPSSPEDSEKSSE